MPPTRTPKMRKYASPPGVLQVPFLAPLLPLVDGDGFDVLLPRADAAFD
jgi:hypothetical protein